MATVLYSLLMSTIAVFATANIIPGAEVQSLGAALVFSVILGVVNTILRPLILLITLPINILSLGLFTFVINAFMVMLVSSITPGIEISGFFTALFFAFILTFLTQFLNRMAVRAALGA